jgi:hypothetical protein
MALRIQARAGTKENVLVLEGWLSGPEVAEFVTLAGSLEQPLRIDLTHVAGADPAGIHALQAERMRGATLAQASPYIELLLRTHVGDTADVQRARS